MGQAQRRPTAGLIVAVLLVGEPLRASKPCSGQAAVGGSSAGLALVELSGVCMAAEAGAVGGLWGGVCGGAGRGGAGRGEMGGKDAERAYRRFVKRALAEPAGSPFVWRRWGVGFWAARSLWRGFGGCGCRDMRMRFFRRGSFRDWIWQRCWRRWLDTTGFRRMRFGGGAVESKAATWQRGWHVSGPIARYGS